jgi:hypothetical protein
VVKTTVWGGGRQVRPHFTQFVFLLTVEAVGDVRPFQWLP